MMDDEIEQKVTPEEFASMATFLASGLASLLAGFALEWSNYATMGVIGACIATLCGVLALAYRPRLRTAQSAF